MWCGVLLVSDVSVQFVVFASSDIRYAGTSEMLVAERRKCVGWALGVGVASGEYRAGMALY